MLQFFPIGLTFAASIAFADQPPPVPPRTLTVTTTSYNPEPGQTDHAPCIGASGRDLCLAAREGDRTIALSRDLLAYYGLGGRYRWHDKVRLRSAAPGCNGVFSVEDTMNVRFSRRADIFSADRAQNVGRCIATVEPFGQ
jgi:hypothetical protein